MKPKKAPEFQGKLSAVLARHPEIARAEQDGRYLHWDEVRRRPPPHGISSEEWWQLIKLARSTRSTALPLTDESGKPFSFVLSDSAHRAVHELELRLRGNSPLPDALRDRGTRKRYERSALVEEAFRSSQLEGASTTRAVAKEMLRTERAPRTESEQMIMSNYRAIGWVRANHEAPLTPGAVLELHSMTMEDILTSETGGGRLRRADERVVIEDRTSSEVVHTPPPAQTLPSRMAAMCRFANGTLRDDPYVPPLARAILLHFWLAYDHPFCDGNGRTARALFYWSMLHQGYVVADLISISRAIRDARDQYDRAFMFTETDGNDATYFLLNQLKMLRAALDDLYAYVGKKQKAIDDVALSVRRNLDLNDRQLAVIDVALRHPSTRFTIEDHRMTHAVAYETARTDLEGLVASGYFEQTRSGKRLYFVPVRNLERLLDLRARRDR